MKRLLCFAAGVAVLAAVSLQAQTVGRIDPDAEKILSTSATGPEVFTKAAATSTTRTYTKSAVIVRRTFNAPPGTSQPHVEVTEEPYVPVPILFAVADIRLFDSGSGRNVEEAARILQRIRAKEPQATFRIEGHASAEGDRHANKDLSVNRSKEIVRLLVELGVPESALSYDGFGAEFANAPASAPESRLQQDRRVLIVRQL